MKKLTEIDYRNMKSTPEHYHWDISKENETGIDNQRIINLITLIEELHKECLNLQSKKLGLELAEYCNVIRRVAEAGYKYTTNK